MSKIFFTTLFLFIEQTSFATQCAHVNEKTAFTNSKNTFLVRITSASHSSATGKILENFKGQASKSIEFRASNSFLKFNSSQPFQKNMNYIVATNWYTDLPGTESGIVEIRLCDQYYVQAQQEDKNLTWLHSQEFKDMSSKTKQAPSK